MSIDLTKDEVERLTLLASAAIMNLPDSVLEGILDKLLAALADPEERAGDATRLRAERDEAIRERDEWKRMVERTDPPGYLETRAELHYQRARAELAEAVAGREEAGRIMAEKRAEDAEAALAEARHALREALRDAREDVAHWAGYASDYFKQKHDLAGDLARIDAALEKAVRRD